MKTRHQTKLLAFAASALALTASLTQAAVTLTNGSFETIGTQYNPAIGGLYAATGWTNLSPTINFQASSVLAVRSSNAEFTSPAGTATGFRYMRLVNDEGDFGALAQNLGTMTTGITYTISADIFGGPSIGTTYGATISLVNMVSLTPTTTYASQTLSGIANTVFTNNAFNFSYTARASDNGNPLVLLLRATAAGGGQASRGGIDDIQLTVVPEPHAALLGGFGLLALLRRRRV